MVCLISEQKTHPGLSYSDKKDIRKTILNDNRVVID